MKLDVNGHLSAVERSVSSLERDGLPARAVTLSRCYATSAEDLWDAVTNVERIPALVSAGKRQSRPRRTLSVGGQRGRHDNGVRTSIAFRPYMGVRRGRQLGRGTLFGPGR